jgi:hypothetical protein
MGRASGPAGLAPEDLKERGFSCKGFYTGFTGMRGVSFNRHQQYSSRPRRCRAHIPGIICVRCALGGVSVRRAPEPGPVRSDRGELLDLFGTLPRRLSAGRRVRFLQLPSIGSRIADSSLSCYWVIQVDAHAPFDKGWLVVRRLVHESAYVGLLGGALLTDKTRIHLRSASVRTYTFFTTGFPRFLSIRGARGLLALNQALI